MTDTSCTTAPVTGTSPGPDRDQLFKMALAVMPRGELPRYVPKHPAWCRRIGHDVWFQLMLDREPDASEIRLLFDAQQRATARREHEQEVERKDREMLDRIAGDQRVAPGAVSAMRKVGKK